MKPELSLSLQFADAVHRAELPRHRVRRWLRAALDAPAQVAVRIVDRGPHLKNRIIEAPSTPLVTKVPLPCRRCKTPSSTNNDKAWRIVPSATP